MADVEFALRWMSRSTAVRTGFPMCSPDPVPSSPPGWGRTARWPATVLAGGDGLRHLAWRVADADHGGAGGRRVRRSWLHRTPVNNNAGSVTTAAIANLRGDPHLFVAGQVANALGGPASSATGCRRPQPGTRSD